MKWFIITSAAAAIIVLSAAGFFVVHFMDNTTKKSDGGMMKASESVVQFKENQVGPEEDMFVEETISEAHVLLNDITGYGDHTKYSKVNNNIDAYEENWEDISLHLEKYSTLALEAAETIEDATLRKDVENFAALAWYAQETYNYDALLYSHRVIHDLDVAFNNENKARFWNSVNIALDEGESTNNSEKVEEIVEKVEMDQ
ncbi:hypothetical protein [Alteribacillus sp. YIM 98480]|uniref:hypothetical protein n=1 Tax=Alteribacillus sp. YIM 98480 TaxID=2606599 RepID=UPI00131D3AFE|nr:hypothetical protein [Alteribacillus sp. YIM 98480]